MKISEAKREACRRYRLNHNTPEDKARRAKWHREYNKKNPERLRLVNKKAYQRQKEWRLTEGKKRNAKLKIETLTYYGHGKCACVKCGESRMACLSIDHIMGNGARHRRQLKTGGGVNFYRWLKRRDFPSGYQTLCMNCQWIKRILNTEPVGRDAKNGENL